MPERPSESSSVAAKSLSHPCMSGESSRLFRMGGLSHWGAGPGIRSLLDRFMACRPDRSIPVIPVSFAHRNMSPRSLPSRAFPLPEACGLPCSVLAGASSFRFQPRRASPRRFWSFPVVVRPILD